MVWVPEDITFLEVEISLCLDLRLVVGRWDKHRVRVIEETRSQRSTPNITNQNVR